MQNVKWKPQAYKQAARSIDSMQQDIKKIYKKGGIKLLEEIPGVGEGIAKKIEEFLKTGKIREHERLKKTIPAHINILMKIPGMGPKKLKKLNKLLKISTIAQLKESALKHKIAKVPGFGNRSEQDILEGIALMKKSRDRIPLKKAEKAAKKIISKLKTLKEVKNISIAGSLRRKRATIGDIDLLISSNNPKKVINKFTTLKNIKKVLAKGPTKASIILKSGMQSDLRVLKPGSWGAGLFYFTGSKNYNIEIRKIAMKKGFKLNEYGLFNKQTGKRIAGKTEKDICKKLGIKYLEPKQREM